MVDAELKGKIFVIRLELQKPQLSTSGKTFVLATTHGFKPTRATYKGNDIYVVANALMKAPPRKKMKRKKSSPSKTHERSKIQEKGRE